MNVPVTPPPESVSAELHPPETASDPLPVAVAEPPAVPPPTPPAPSITDANSDRNTPSPPLTLLPTPTPPPATAASNSLIKDQNPVRMLLTVSVGFIALFLFLRTFALEPFGVPTGSMAPNLIGNHRAGPCPRCGYLVRIGFPPPGGNVADQFGNVACPNCGKRFSLADARDLSGDRLLVDKNVFNLRRPRRWEMAVFRCPDPDPKECGKPYVKRVIGLPGETIRVIDGDVYANDVLIRKDLAEMRETRIPVCDMSYPPQPQGWNARWLVEPSENDPRLPRVSGRTPEEADSSVVHGASVTLDAADPARPSAAVRYRHWNLDEQRDEPVRAWSSYDGMPRAFNQLPPVHDFSFTCDVEVVAAADDAVLSCTLSDGADAVTAEIAVGARSDGLATILHPERGGLAAIRGISLAPHHTYRLEYAFVDRRVFLVLDGKPVLPPADLPPAAHRGEVPYPVRLAARGCRLDIRDFVLYRDIYYTQFGEHGTLHPAVLGPQEYFVLGDNSGNSQDSRKWPAPGVPEVDFLGKPFLIHQPLRPSRVAFGGQEQVFQTVDWSRLRWLH